MKSPPKVGDLCVLQVHWTNLWSLTGSRSIRAVHENEILLVLDLKDREYVAVLAGTDVGMINIHYIKAL